MARKMAKKEDRISDLPDCIIQYILSLLPSTKQVIQTGILSKHWKYQWTHVPVLIFDSTGMNSGNFFKFIDKTLFLHDCSKIKKFHLQYKHSDKKKDPRLTDRILFATRKYVEDFNLISIYPEYVLPSFLFNCSSLVKLSIENCTFMLNGKVNWGCLTELNIVGCQLAEQTMEHILSGSSLLKSLELTNSYEFGNLRFVIASQSLKRLVLRDIDLNYSSIEISCSNLEELSLKNVKRKTPKLFFQGIENVLSNCSLLESFELINCSVFDQLVIRSKSLKSLVLGELYSITGIEISCLKLEKLKLLGIVNIGTAEFLNLPTSLCATFDFYSYVDDDSSIKSLTKDILHQLQHVNELKVGWYFTKSLTVLEAGDLFYPVLNIKCLTLRSPNLVKHMPGIACVLRSSPLLEKLVIEVPLNDQRYDYFPKANTFEESYWNLNAIVFNCLVYHLKTIKIIGFPKKDDIRKLLLNLVQFLLKNARLLEKMMVELKGRGTAFPLKVSKELLSLPRCSHHAIIEFITS